MPALAVLACAWTAGAAEGSDATPPNRIHPGSIAVGLSGSLNSVEGSTRGTLAVRGGIALAAGAGTVMLELEPSYSHVQGLDVLDLQGLAGWQAGIGATSLHIFFGLGGGVRQEWLGSFELARFPVGAQFGANALVSQSAGVRVEYRYRRVLDDPVADFDEHQVFLGITLYLRNRPS